MTRLSITSLNFDADIVESKNDLTLAFEKALARKSPSYFVAWNPEKIVNTSSLVQWPEIRRQSSGNYADGIGINIAMRMLLGKKIERVTGVDFFSQVLSMLNASGGKLFMFGATSEVLTQAVANVQKEFPNLRIVGSVSGFDYDNDHLIQTINLASPDVIAVALGSPKQEEWIFNHGMKVKSGVYMGVGGTFSILSGMSKRAPAIFRKTGLEWFYRLVTEPSRLKRQVALPIFLWHLMREKCRPQKTN